MSKSIEDRVIDWISRHGNKGTAPRDLVASRIVPNADNARAILESLFTDGRGAWTRNKFYLLSSQVRGIPKSFQDEIRSGRMREVTEFPGYYVSDVGEVFSVLCGKQKKLKPNKTTTGYLQVYPVRDGKNHARKVHLLVCKAFHGPRPGSPRQVQAAHADGNKLNNAASNLRWASRSENEREKHWHGTSNAGARNGQSKLNESDVRRILASNEDAKSLACQYGVSPMAIRDIKAQRTWKHVKRGDLTLVIPDIHMPYHLPQELETYLDFGVSIRPNRVVLLGDVIDAMTVSRFDKNPARKTTLAGEIEVVQFFLSDLRKRFPVADIHYCEGNHEDRLRKYLWKKAPELAGIRGLNIPELLDLDRFRIRWHTPFDNLRVGNLTYTHANRIRKTAGWTARALSDELSASIICGHSHRQGWCPRTASSGTYDAYEAGCLCDYRLLDYIDNVPNWQIGGATVETFSSGEFHVDFARFLPDGSLVWRGEPIV